MTSAILAHVKKDVRENRAALFIEKCMILLWETKFFEFCYAEGDKELRMGGVSLRLRDMYRDYYAWRKENEKETLEE